MARLAVLPVIQNYLTCYGNVWKNCVLTILSGHEHVRASHQSRLECVILTNQSQHYHGISQSELTTGYMPLAVKSSWTLRMS